MYLPANADADGWGTLVEAEVEQWFAAAAAADPWLAENPPTVEWTLDIPPAEVDPEHPLVAATLAASERVGEPSRLAGLDSWFDAASFTRFGGTPSIGFGPRDIAWAHTIDEYVPVDDLVRCSQALALAAVDYCGVASERADHSPAMGDSALVTKLLRSFFSHEGRVVEHLQPERRGDPRRPRPRVLHAGRRPRRGDDHHPHLGRRRLQR